MDEKKIAVELRKVCATLDEEELRLILRRFGHVSVELETHRFVERLLRDDDRILDLRRFEWWLERARPAKSSPAPGGERVSEEEIERRLAHYRRNTANAVEYDDIYKYENPRLVLEPAEVEAACAEYESKLRRR